MDAVDFLFPGIVLAVLVGLWLGKYVRAQDGHWYGTSPDLDRDRGGDDDSSGGDGGDGGGD
jgi:hypothetical protein